MNFLNYVEHMMEISILNIYECILHRVIMMFENYDIQTHLMPNL